MTGRPVTIAHSYAPGDVTFLLKPVALAPTGLAEKERLIQTGAAHYSEMISQERRPDPRYLAIYEAALDRGAARVAREVTGLAATLAAEIAAGRLDARITLCSLVRAGVPYGVLLVRALRALGLDAVHFGVSIIRDRGLDPNAMAAILAERPAGGVVFVDGWTGKGAIAGELGRAWVALSGKPPRLAVLADPSGHATFSGSHEDWLIPSGILGANVSGLVSRSILRADLIGPDDFHGAIPVPHLADIDVSRAFVDRITALMPKARAQAVPHVPDPGHLAALRTEAARTVDGIDRAFGVSNFNRIKPGIAEATRAVLRRRPERVFLRDAEDADLSALRHLCAADGVETEISAERTGPYRAITLIARTA